MPSSRSAASRRVGERPGHPGEVPDGRALPAPLGQRARGLALEVDHDPVAVGRPEHLAEVVVAVGPDREPGRADGGELVDEVAEVLRPVRHGAERVVVGEGCERRPDLLVDLGGEQPERLGARLLGCEVRVGFVRGERAVHARGHLAEPPGMLGQPRRVVAERLERELPAPARGWNHRGDRRERGLEGRPSRLEHSLQPRGVREPLRGERAEDLELRVRPCLEPAVELEEMKVVEHDGAVRLLDADRCHLRALRRERLRARRGVPPPRAARRRRPPRRRLCRARRGSARACRGRSEPRRSRA